MSKFEPKADAAETVVNPYAVAGTAQEAVDAQLSWRQKVLVGGVSSTVSLLVLTLLLTVLGLVVTALYDLEPYSREATHLIITALLIGGTILSLGISLLAGSRAFRKLQKSIRTLSGPTAARVKLEQEVAALVRDRSPP
jgi:hypothetical protein